MIFLPLIRLRIKQGLRMAQEVGPLFLLIFGLPVLFYFGVFLWKLAGGEYLNEFFYGILFLTLSIQLTRKDKDFQRKLWGSGWRLRAAEYLFLWSPFLIAMLMGGGWMQFSGTVGGLILLSLIPWTFTGIKMGSLSFRILPAADFEWRTGLKSTWYMLLGLMAVGFIFAQETAVIPLVIIAISLLVGNFNRFAEPVQMLQPFPPHSTAFLREKIKRQGALFFLLVLPLAITWLFFFYMYWVALAAAFLISSLTLLFSILLKYSHYRPHTDLKMHWHWMWLTPLWFCLPFLIPIPFLLCLRAWRKASTNLNYYLA